MFVIKLLTGINTSLLLTSKVYLSSNLKVSGLSVTEPVSFRESIHQCDVRASILTAILLIENILRVLIG